MPTVRSFETWQHLLAAMQAAGAGGLASPGSWVAGHVDARGGWGYTSPALDQDLSGLVRAGAARTGTDPVGVVQAALRDAQLARVPFVAHFHSGGRVVLHVLDFGPAVEAGGGGLGLGSVVLAEGAVPEPWRRQPARSPGATPAPSADPDLLERTLRERLPGAEGATEAGIAAAGARLGLSFPEEMTALYRVTGARRQDDRALADRVFAAVGCDLLPLDEVFVATPATRPLPWIFAAQEVATTTPGDAVQALVGSPGWIVFGIDGGGDRMAVDLTPGTGGDTGQVIAIPADDSWGAALLARSLTAMVLGEREPRGRSRRDPAPALARVNRVALRSIEAAASPHLEVLSIGGWDGAPLSLAPVAGLPRLRTLTALPGTLADPLQVAALPALEYLELGPREWRAVLDAGAVPPGLLAAAVTEANEDEDPLTLVAIADELLALRDRPRIARTTLEGHLYRRYR